MSDLNPQDLADLLGDEGSPNAANQNTPHAVREYVIAAALVKIADRLDTLADVAAWFAEPARVTLGEQPAPDAEPTAYPVRPDGSPLEAGDRVTVPLAYLPAGALVDGETTAVGVISRISDGGDGAVAYVELEDGRNVRVYLEAVRYHGPHETDDDDDDDDLGELVSPPAVDTFAALKSKGKSKGKASDA